MLNINIFNQFKTMPKLSLSSKFIQSIVCPTGARKVDFFDNSCKGLMLVVHSSGHKTYSLRYQDKRGKTRQTTLADASDISLTQAKLLAEKKRNQIAMGEDLQVPKKKIPTVNVFIEDYYLPFVKSYKRSWLTDKGLLRNHIQSIWGDRYLDEITKQDVVKFITEHRVTHAPGSCNRIIILLRYVFNMAQKWEMVNPGTNPTQGLPLMQENNMMERYLTGQETNELYEALLDSENPMLKYIIPMLMLTGARKREVLDAKWVDLDLEHQTWKIPVNKSGKARHVPLSEGVVSLLHTVPRLESCEWVFPNPKTQSPFVSIYCSWNTARKKAGLAEVRVHDLRHSFASFLVNAGRSLYEVQKILGHTQIKTTQRYAHLSQDSLIAAANEAANVMSFLKK